MIRLLVGAALSFSLGCTTTGGAAGGDGPRPTPVNPSEPARFEASAIDVHDVEPDAEMEALLSPFRDEVDARANRVIGELSGPLMRGKPESTLGIFVADAMRAGMAEAVGGRVDMCFTNTGGLRRDLDKGPVTEGLVIELMPFDNTVIVFSMTGAALRGMMDQVAARGDPVSGVRYTRKGRRAHNLKLIDGTLEDGGRYRVCTSDYLFEGGGGYTFDAADDVTYTGVLLRDLILKHFERGEGPIAPPDLGNVKEGS